MDCQQCGGECYDNREKNRQRVQNGDKPMPDFKCRDKNCGWVKWPPKTKSGGSGTGTRGQGAPAGAGPRNSRPLGPLYFQCMKVAKATLDAVMGKGNYSGSDLTAATATLFIGARDGAPILTPKPKPAPPPPPPEPEDEEDDGSFDPPDGLPF